MNPYCGCGNPCDHGLRGFGELAPEGVNPWDTSRWTITEWAALAGLVASAVWVWHLTTKGK